MPARVNIEAKAFGDHRFTRLGRLLLASLMGGHVATQEALPTVDQFRHPRMQWRVGVGAMAEVWSHCTEENIDVVPEDDLADIVGHPHAAQLLERCKLGEIVDGGVRIRGATGRIEWLEKKRRAAKKGGEAKRKKAKRKPGAKPDGSVEGEHNDDSGSTHMGTPLALAPTLTPTQEQPPLPPDGDGVDLKRVRADALAFEAIQTLGGLTGGMFNCRAVATQEAFVEILERDPRLNAEQVRDVVKAKVDEWQGGEMAGNLKPGVLFKPGNFLRYLSDLGAPEHDQQRSRDVAKGSASPTAREDFHDGPQEIPR